MGIPSYLARGAGPVSVGVHSTGAPPALSPPPTGLWGGGVPQTSAGMPSAASRMGVEALPGAFPAPFRGKSDRVSNARGNPGAVLGTICRDMGGVEVRFQVEYEHVEE